jgi:alpha-L-rhamnosidase
MLDQSNVAKHMQEYMVQTDRFVLKGKGIESFETKFTYHGFQFIEVSGFSGQLKIDDITAVAAATDMKERGAFECSNPTLNQIQKNTLWSFLSNYYGYPTDCPHREKNGWTGDAQLAVETGLWNFHAHAAYTKYFEDMADEQRSDGNLAAIIPSSQWGYFWGNGPAWIGAYIIMPWQMYIYDGDQRVLENHYNGMKQMLSWFTSNAENHILSIGLGDWAPFETKTPVSLTSTAYYYHFACILFKVAKLLDKQEDYQYFTRLSEQIKKAFNQTFYNSKTGVYANGSQTAQSCAIYFQLVD